MLCVVVQKRSWNIHDCAKWIHLCKRAKTTDTAHLCLHRCFVFLHSALFLSFQIDAKFESMNTFSKKHWVGDGTHPGINRETVRHCCGCECSPRISSAQVYFDNRTALILQRMCWSSELPWWKIYNTVQKWSETKRSKLRITKNGNSQKQHFWERRKLWQRNTVNKWQHAGNRTLDGSLCLVGRR